MPTKRRKRPARSIGHMTDVQRLHLICGSYLIAHYPAEEFVDERHRRETWGAYRDQILGEWDHPGRRPAALWEYDAKLRRVPYPKNWSWPRPIRTEAQMVHKLLLAGELEGCRVDGRVPITSELEAIEEWWLVILRCPGSWNIEEVPVWFRRQHGSQIKAEIKADRAKSRAMYGNGAAAAE